jgi:RimJ/RimL family protein N-acetyltransferase
MDFLITTIESKNICLRPLDEADYEDLYAVASDPLVWEQHPVKRNQKEVFDLFFTGAIDSKTSFAIIDLASDSLIGTTRYYDFSTEESSVGIGYTFMSRAYWGRGFNREVKKVMIEKAFEYVSLVKFHVALSNIRSQKAVQKLGAIPMKELDFDLGLENLVKHFEYHLVKD